MSPDIYELANGIRVVHHEVTSTKLVHCGYILDVGSRDEGEHEQGLAHFWEHMAFKGTRKRKAFHIINRLESVGGELNAYTTKEKICFYASVLDRYASQAVDLLTDITFDSIFPEKQIEREKSVILEEIAMYRDDPEDDIQDEFDQLVFGDHPLAHNILGTDRHIRSFERKDFVNFIQRHLDTHRLIFSIVGNVTPSKVKRLMKQFLEPLPATRSEHHRTTFDGYDPVVQTRTRSIQQSHCALGRTVMPVQHPDRLPFFMLTNILGGPGMNSRLNLALREKYGYVYGIDAHFSALSDTGLFAVYFATDPVKMDKSKALVRREFQLLKHKPLGKMQLQKAKEQLMGQLAMAEENNVALMLAFGKSLLDLHHIPSLDAIFAEIESISADKLQELAQAYLQEDEFSELTYMPETK